MNRKITIITNYFPPESGAASNRISSMAEGFIDNGYCVKIVCPLPSYPAGKIFKPYRTKLFHQEKRGNLTIYRLWHIPSNSSSKFIRLFSMLSFCFSLFWFLLIKKLSSITLVQMSPLFVGFTAVFILRLKRKKIILNVSDLWPLAGLEMGMFQKGFYYNVLEKIERYCYKKAHLILGQSREILTHIKKYSPDKTLFLYQNFPRFQTEFNAKKKIDSREIQIVYAGLLGVAQGVPDLLKNLKIPEGVALSIYGDGPDSKIISELANSNPHINYYGIVAKNELQQKILNFDLALIPLKNRIYGSVPSKIFELSLLGVPVVYFSDGEGAEIVEKYGLGFVVDENYTGTFQELLIELQQGKVKLPSSKHIKETAQRFFDFDKQFELLLKEIKKN